MRLVLGLPTFVMQPLDETPSRADWLPWKPADILKEPADMGSGDGDWAELGCSGQDFRERLAVGVNNLSSIRRTQNCRMIL